MNLSLFWNTVRVGAATLRVLWLRSAGWQPAVSPPGSRLSVGNDTHVEGPGIPQVANLRNSRLTVCATAVAAALTVSAAAAAVVEFDSGPVNQWIPDDSATGIASTINVSEVGVVAAVSVRFELSVPANQTGWLGDLYAYLRHDDGFAVLLNRLGRTSVNPFGYGDSQAVNLTFADSAVNGDIHGYRAAAPLSASGSLVGPLLGSWAPDGRAADPAVVLDTTPRTALLGGFAGHSLTGNWTLFVADLSSGGQHRLDGWALEFELQPSPVPEPATGTAVMFTVLLALALARRPPCH
jgi:subtilisin-like proprotein convertase family protein